MHRFWDTIIEPVLEIIKPGAIVEIGCFRGLNTRNIVEYCSRCGGVLHAIDPEPEFDVEEWQEKYGNTLVFYKTVSLHVLPKIEKFDVVFIDGDHNWYTVYNELKIIEQRCRQNGRPFPLVMLHDTGWPYARRDMYYNPETIPLTYRKPYEQKGIRPGSPELQEKGGLNASLFNAIYEGNLQNGVLTAVEDFIKTSNNTLELIKIPGLHGLGIICPAQLNEQNKKLYTFINNLIPSPVLEQYIKLLEGFRINSVILGKENYETLKAKESQFAELEQRLADTEKTLSETRTKQKEEVEHLQDEVRQFTTALRVQKAQVAQLEQRLSGAEKVVSEKDQQLSVLNSVLRQRNQDVEKYARKVEQIKFHGWQKGYKNDTSRIKCADYDYKLYNKNTNLPSAQPASTCLIPESLMVDIVICVHNALDDVRACLESIIKNASRKFTLYIVNDGSDEPTTNYLQQFSSTKENIVLLENSLAQGYTCAANKGLRASAADYVILLNSDTIVPPKWLDKILECGESDPGIGIIGPLSNAASWQSVPELFDKSGDWAINVLPDGFTVEDMDNIVGLVSKKQFPRVPFINGFCFAIKRNVIETIGRLDEEAFPYGYGEENDYCLRASYKGIQMAIADHLYVFHAKSKSFGHEQRLQLSTKGNSVLAGKHGKERINKLVAQIKNDLILNGIRRNIRKRLQALSGKVNPTLFDLRILFLLPVPGTGGGIHSVVQEVSGMRRLGIHARIAIKKEDVYGYYRNYNSISECHELFIPFATAESLIDVAESFNVVVATIYNSCKLISMIVDRHPHILPAYYVQDYEPFFFAENGGEWQEAFNSYTLIPNCVLFAKTDWLVKVVEDKHGIPVYRVCPSLDHDIYYPDLHSGRLMDTIRVVAMIRPNTPRRGPGRTMRVLKRLSREFGDHIKIEIFGCTNDDKGFVTLDRDLVFCNHGILVREEVAELLRQADIFLDLSDYQAFGRTGVEAMACGCAVVLPVTGGVHEYAVHRHNALLVDTHDEEATYNAVRELVISSALRSTLQRKGLAAAANYSIHRAAMSILQVLATQREKNISRRAHIFHSSSITSKVYTRPEPGPLRVAALVARRGDGKPAGSGNIRIIQPLTHPSIREKLELKVCLQNELMDTDADIIVVQRNMISNIGFAKSIIERCQRDSIKLVLEVDDDLFDVHGYRLRVGYAPSPVLLETLALLANKADAVITSSPPLQQTLREFNPRVYSLPNALDEEVWALNESPPELSQAFTVGEDKFRILYMGTFTHMYDLALVETAADGIVSEYPGRVVFEMVGGLPNGKQLFGKQIFPQEKSATDDYQGFVKWLRKRCNWDFGIIPLDVDDFNRKKSYIKFLDYSALGIASICTDIEPYRAVVKHGVNGLLVPNTAEAWYAAMKGLIDDRLYRHNLAVNAYRDLLGSHTLAVRANDYLRVYQEITKIRK